MVSGLNLFGAIGSGINQAVPNYVNTRNAFADLAARKQQQQLLKQLPNIFGNIGGGLNSPFPATPGINPVANNPAGNNVFGSIPSTQPQISQPTQAPVTLENFSLIDLQKTVTKSRQAAMQQIGKGYAIDPKLGQVLSDQYQQQEKQFISTQIAPVQKAIKAANSRAQLGDLAGAKAIISEMNQINPKVFAGLSSDEERLPAQLQALSSFVDDDTVLDATIDINSKRVIDDNALENDLTLANTRFKNQKQLQDERIDQDALNRESNETVAGINSSTRQQKALLDITKRELEIQKIQGEIDATNSEGEKDKLKSELKAQSRELQIENVLNEVDEAKDLADGGLSTGIVGKVLSIVPGTDSVKLRNAVMTIKANVGFDKLQNMRDLSPTGGALGQVAVQELDALQSSIASLNPDIGGEQLIANLNKVQRHYGNWLLTTKGIDPKTYRTATNPSTGDIIQSMDGGQTWQPKP